MRRAETLRAAPAVQSTSARAPAYARLVLAFEGQLKGDGSLMITRIRFATYLGAMAAEIRKARSGEKTTLKLLAAGAILLEGVNYRDLNVEDICAEAGLAKGTFYIYFETKDEFLRELARRYVAFEAQMVPGYDSQESLFQSTVRWVDWYEGSFATNVGVLRCIVQMGDADYAMRAIWHQRNEFVVRSTIEIMERRAVAAAPPREHLVFVVRTVGGLLDQSLFNRFQVNAGTGHEQPYGHETLVRLHAALLYRALYGVDPPRDEASDVLEMLPSMRSA